MISRALPPSVLWVGLPAGSKLPFSACCYSAEEVAHDRLERACSDRKIGRIEHTTGEDGEKPARFAFISPPPDIDRCHIARVCAGQKKIGEMVGGSGRRGPLPPGKWEAEEVDNLGDLRRAVGEVGGHAGKGGESGDAVWSG
jgi:hypothetical protein